MFSAQSITQRVIISYECYLDLEEPGSASLSRSRHPVDMPPQLVGDQSRLKQVLINLTKNALNHTTGGNI